jgi:hypothetical protein
LELLPSAGLTAGFLLALVPGWLYLRLRSSRNAVLPRSGLDEVLEVVTIGVATTGLAVALWALLPFEVTHLADVRALVREPNVYSNEHVRRLAATALVVFLLACSLAWCLFKLTHRGPRPTLYRETVWAGALTRRGEKYPWVGVQLRDGRLVEGELHAVPTGDEHENRDISLQAPIKVTPAGGGTRQDTSLDRIILNEIDIKYIGLVLGPEVTTPGGQPPPGLGAPLRWLGSRLIQIGGGTL